MHCSERRNRPPGHRDGGGKPCNRSLAGLERARNDRSRSPRRADGAGNCYGGERLRAERVASVATGGEAGESGGGRRVGDDGGGRVVDHADGGVELGEVIEDQGQELDAIGVVEQSGDEGLVGSVDGEPAEIRSRGSGRCARVGLRKRRDVIAIL
jgi:hypothetical protein